MSTTKEVKATEVTYLHGWTYFRPKWSEELLNKETMVKKLHIDELRSCIIKLEDLSWIFHRDIRSLDAALVNHVGHGGLDRHPAATSSVAGFLSSGDKSKLDNDVFTHFTDGRVTNIPDPVSPTDAVNYKSFKRLEEDITDTTRRLNDEVASIGNDLAKKMPRYTLFYGDNNGATSPGQFSRDVPTSYFSLGAITMGCTYYNDGNGIDSMLFEMGVRCAAPSTARLALRYVDDNVYFYLNGARIFEGHIGRQNTIIDIPFRAGDNLLQIVTNNTGNCTQAINIAGDIIDGTTRKWIPT